MAGATCGSEAAAAASGRWEGADDDAVAAAAAAAAAASLLFNTKDATPLPRPSATRLMCCTLMSVTRHTRFTSYIT